LDKEGVTNYHSWQIGAGNDCNIELFSNSKTGNYGKQLAVGRNETNPKLSERRKLDLRGQR
jgi:hypothetical protein